MTQFASFCGHEQFQPQTILEHAVQAEAVGFDALTVSGHFHSWVDDASASGFGWTVEIHRSLVELGADVVTLQVTSVNHAETIESLGRHLLPALRRLVPAPVR